MIKVNLFICILLASSSLLALSCVNQQDEWPISPDKYVFIDHHVHTHGESIEGECPTLYIDFPTYSFSEVEKTLSVRTDFKVDSSVKIIYGDGVSLSGDGGAGAATGLKAVYELPFEQRGLEIVNVEPDGTAHLKYNGLSIILKSGEKWVNTTTKIDTQNSCKRNLTITDRIVNYGILDKSKIKKL